ncbi:MAG TPA: sensor histidine kinase, partial [Candidatus Copromorpha excrementigallinarum]|nr:sensor histidine kinase [Candidatus Copromorpha excrementigallinarum]
PKSVVFILKQLLINCAKYCPGCHVKIKAAKGVITLEDDGIGIPSHEVERVTDRGFSGTNGRRLGKSTGMGLYIVKELCGQLGTDLEIASEEGEFTRVTMKFQGFKEGEKTV